MIPCPACGARLTPPAFLDACTTSWPQKKWVLFVCPACDHLCHVHLRRGSVALGYLDGGPGPCFFEEQVVPLPDLRFKAAENGIRVSVRGRSRLIPGR